MLDRRTSRDLDNYITGHYGEDQIKEHQPMVINARVVSIESADGYTDKRRRITLSFLDADSMFRQIRLALDPKIFGSYEPKLDDTLCFECVGELAQPDAVLPIDRG